MIPTVSNVFFDFESFTLDLGPWWDLAPDSWADFISYWKRPYEFDKLQLSKREREEDKMIQSLILSVTLVVAVCETDVCKGRIHMYARVIKLPPLLQYPLASCM